MAGFQVSLEEPMGRPGQSFSSEPGYDQVSSGTSSVCKRNEGRGSVLIVEASRLDVAEVDRCVFRSVVVDDARHRYGAGPPKKPSRTPTGSPSGSGMERPRGAGSSVSSRATAR